MITNIHDLIIAIENAVYGETIIVNESIFQLVNNIWSCSLRDDFEIKNLNFIRGD